MVSDVVFSALLGCTQGTSNKQYFVTVEKNDAEYAVYARWGPRGRLGRPFCKGSGNDPRIASTHAENLVAEKIAKGYVVESRSA